MPRLVAAGGEESGPRGGGDGEGSGGAVLGVADDDGAPGLADLDTVALAAGVGRHSPCCQSSLLILIMRFLDSAGLRAQLLIMLSVEEMGVT